MLNSAPEEDYISIHIRVIADFTMTQAKVVSCDYPAESVKEDRGDLPANACGKVVLGTNTNHPRVTNLPRVMIDWPFRVGMLARTFDL